MTVFAADLKVLPLAVFGVVLCITLGVTYLGTKLSSEKGNERNYDELYVRSETGLGAEGAEPVRRKPRRREAAPEPAGVR
jgi:hypothetical protein